MWKGTEKTLILSGEEVPDDCPSGAWSNYSQRACRWPLQRVIPFSEQFEGLPTIQVVAVSLWTDLTPCILRMVGTSGYYENGIAMDAQLAFAANVTSTGFVLRGGSSTENGPWVCGGDPTVYDAWIPNVVRWTAIGKKKSF